MKQQKNQRPKITVKPKDILAGVMILGLILGIYLFVNPGQPGEYINYAGPVLPLSSISGGEEITAVRNVVLDFGAYADRELDNYNGYITVTDSYMLTNPTSEAVTVELVWGFEGQFTDPGTQIPAITVDGEPVEGRIYPATDNGELVRNAYSFEKYAQVLTENDFLAEAMAGAPLWDVAVTVYHFYDVAYTGEPVTGKPYLDIAYKIGPDTALWVRDYDVMGMVDGYYHLKFHADRGEVWLYVIGEDLLEMEAAGSRGSNVTLDAVSSEALEGVVYELEIYESTFMECLSEYIGEYQIEPDSDLGQRYDLMTKQMLFDGAMKRIVGTNYQNLTMDVHSMQTILGDVYSNIRMLYWVFPVEIPAGGTVTVMGTYDQECSRDYGATRHGYDVATTLGSNLNFVSQTATVANSQYVLWDDEEQNFGFDLENGVTTVALDLTVERYFLGLIPQ